MGGEVAAPLSHAFLARRPPPPEGPGEIEGFGEEPPSDTTVD